MPALLLELFSEEIPARMQKEAAAQLERMFEAALRDADLPHGAIQSYVTPRRLALSCADLPLTQSDRTIEKKGPKTSAPQAALDGFLKSSGLTLDRLEKRGTGKEECYFAIIHQKGEPVAALLKPLIEAMLNNFPWPKSMRWGSGETRWVRPLRSLLCLFGDTTIPIAFGRLTASNITYGHRFLAPAAITVISYKAQLEKAYVLVDREARQAEILTQAETLAASHHLTVKPDRGLLEEVTGLVEWPKLLLGRIDAAFMDLPPEVLISEMRAHQKYLALQDDKGALAPYFIIVSNIDGGAEVIAGNERVLRARLSDGRFFYDQDRKKPLSDWAEGLKHVTFHAKIGTIAEKVERVIRLAITIAEQTRADKKLTERAAALCKADLVTGMVGEFPELQGVMGRYYALAQGEDAAIADAIRDHYLPLGPDSPVPAAPVSIAVALADKFDTLISLFAAGEKPTGSKDPFALRRAALGIIRIILENNLRLTLGSFLTPELIAFFSDRLKVMLRDQGIRHDVIASIMANGDDDLVRVMARAKALQDFLSLEDGANLLAAYRRAGNILTIEEKKDGRSYTGEWNSTKLIQKEECELNLGLLNIKEPIETDLREENYKAAMTKLALLRQAIDPFFDKVLINDTDPTIRHNRLELLAGIRRVMNVIADFGVIEG